MGVPLRSAASCNLRVAIDGTTPTSATTAPADPSASASSASANASVSSRAWANSTSSLASPACSRPGP